MTILLADKEITAEELARLGPVLLIQKNGYVQVEKLPEPDARDYA